MDKNKNGNSLHKAAAVGDVGIVKKLLKKTGVTPNDRDPSGQTILHIAAMHGHVRLANYLLKHTTSNINAVDKNLWTPILTACQYSRLYMCEALLAANCSLRMRTRDGNTVLHYVARTKTIDHVRLQRIMSKFLTACSVKDVNKLGESPLHYAASRGLATTVTYLVQHGADVNLCNEFGDTPIIFAVRSANIETTRALLTAKADVNICGADGDAWATALSMHHEELVELLRPHSQAAALEAEEKAKAEKAKAEKAKKEREAKERAKVQNGFPADGMQENSMWPPPAHLQQHMATHHPHQPPLAMHPSFVSHIPGYDMRPPSMAGGPHMMHPMAGPQQMPHAMQHAMYHQGPGHPHMAPPHPHGAFPPTMMPGSAGPPAGYYGHDRMAANPYGSVSGPSALAQMHQQYGSAPQLMVGMNAPPSRLPSRNKPRMPAATMHATVSGAQGAVMSAKLQKERADRKAERARIREERKQRRAERERIREEKSKKLEALRAKQQLEQQQMQMQAATRPQSIYPPEALMMAPPPVPQTQEKPHLSLANPAAAASPPVLVNIERRASLIQVDQVGEASSSSEDDMFLSPRQPAPSSQGVVVPTLHPPHSASPAPVSNEGQASLGPTPRQRADDNEEEDDDHNAVRNLISSDYELTPADIAASHDSVVVVSSNQPKYEAADGSSNTNSILDSFAAKAMKANEMENENTGAGSRASAKLRALPRSATVVLAPPGATNGSVRHPPVNEESESDGDGDDDEDDTDDEIVDTDDEGSGDSSSGEESEFRSQTSPSVAATHTSLAASGKKAEDDRMSPITMLLQEVEELCTWLVRELQRGNVRTAKKMEPKLRVRAQPLLDHHLFNPRAQSTILKLHHALSEYDRVVEGAQENLGIGNYIRRMQRGTTTSSSAASHATKNDGGLHASDPEGTTTSFVSDGDAGVSSDTASYYDEDEESNSQASNAFHSPTVGYNVQDL